MFWLSHHLAPELHRTYQMGSVRLCARCLGLYPALVLTLALLFARHAPLAWPHETAWVLLLTLPSVADWSWGRFRPEAGSNGWRTFTGVLLGLALGRTLYVHLQKPWPSSLVWQLALVTGGILPVILWRRR